VIALLTGLVVHEEADGTVVLDVNGVGYEVLAPLGTIGRLRAGTPQGALTLFVHTHVREDTFQLFGFASALDRTVFRLLIGVSTVGPRTAMAVLSSLPAPELARVISRKELARLTAVPGIGKKIAERLLLELRDKLPSGAELAAGPRPAPAGPVPTGPAPDNRERLVFALTRSGYRQQEVERVAEQLGDKLDALPLPELVREALRLLAK
jgi:holliday junction DNA helicase RuvA